MNTQTHLLLACAVLVPAATSVSPRIAITKTLTVAITFAALLGALMPDASLFVMWGVAKSQGVADSVIWSEWYYSAFWQWVGAITNSLPLYFVIAIAGFLFGGRLPANYRASVLTANLSTSGGSVSRPGNTRADEAEVMEAESSGFPSLLSRAGLLILVFALAALIHALTDFPLHHDDGHPHFWPLTNWIFRSPVSYWDPAHFGNIWSVVEFILALILIVLLWRRFDVVITRFVLFVVAVSYVVVSFYWWQLF